MELRLAFTGFVFAFCAVVLADRIYGFSGRIASALGWTRPAAEGPELMATGQTRHDWYVHFHRDVVTGHGQARPPQPATRQAPRQTRPDTRPRLHA